MRMSEFAGMTVEERLLLSGMNFCFDEAAQAGNRSKMIQILVALGIAPAGAAKLVETMLVSPEKDEF
jgi:hypothetical protein